MQGFCKWWSMITVKGDLIFGGVQCYGMCINLQLILTLSGSCWQWGVFVHVQKCQTAREHSAELKSLTGYSNALDSSCQRLFLKPDITKHVQRQIIQISTLKFFHLDMICLSKRGRGHWKKNNKSMEFHKIGEDPQSLSLWVPLDYTFTVEPPICFSDE